MGEQAHTPGPLGILPDGGLWSVVVVERALGFEAFTVTTASYCTKGDATLYASAPDLLEALSRATSWIADLPRKGSSHSMRSDKLAELRAAIAKATGGAQ